MTSENKSAATAALIIMLAFGLGWYFMPAIMIAIGNYSTVVAGLFAAAFVAAFFLIFWLRGRQQRGK
jgi:drug/metabolite transporter (DMT)-like permease